MKFSDLKDAVPGETRRVEGIHVVEHSAYQAAIDAAKEFGKHKSECIGNLGHQNYDHACDCGFDEALKELGEKL